MTMGIFAASLVGGWVYMGREWEEGEESLKKDVSVVHRALQFGLTVYLFRANWRVWDLDGSDARMLG